MQTQQVGWSSIKFTSATQRKEGILAPGRAYIDKDKFSQPTQRNVLYVTLIANLLLMVMQKGLKRSWSFSGLATMARITMMYYVDFRSLFNNPEKG